MERTHTKNSTEELIRFGKTDIFMQPFGVGAWAWGDRVTWEFGKDYSEADVKQAFDASLEAGIRFFDTAEVYGFGKSERLLGKFARQARTSQKPDTAAVDNIIVATKFLPFPWRLWSEALVGALRQSLARLSLEKVDLYQVHMPFPPMPVETWAKGLVSAVKAGLARAVGVSNYSANRMDRVNGILSDAGIPLASNQVEYSLLDRKIESNGVMDYCKAHDVSVIAYSPIGKGLLTGKYSVNNPPPGIRRKIYTREKLDRIEPLIGLMREIGSGHSNRTPSQVALNWCICKGTIPIPGAKNARQAVENAGALGWRLSGDEVDALDNASEAFSK